MKGRRSFTDREEERILQVARESTPLEHALVYLFLYTGFRAKEVLSLRLGQVWRNNKILPEIGVPPRALKFKRATTRWIPVSAPLAEALSRYVGWLQQHDLLAPSEPLFRRINGDRLLDQALDYRGAFKLAKEVFRRARVRNERLGLHSFRKRFAHVVYLRSGRSLAVACQSLGHSRVEVTEGYLSCDPRSVAHAIHVTDWTRRPRKPIKEVYPWQAAAH